MYATNFVNFLNSSLENVAMDWSLKQADFGKSVVGVKETNGRTFKVSIFPENPTDPTPEMGWRDNNSRTTLYLTVHDEEGCIAVVESMKFVDIPSNLPAMLEEYERVYR